MGKENVVRKLFIGLTPIVEGLEIDSQNTTQVKNFISLAELGLKDLKFKVLDTCLGDGGDGTVELGVNLNTINFDKEEFEDCVKIVKGIFTRETPDYDDETTFPDIVKRFYNICNQYNAVNIVNELDDQSWRVFTKLIMVGGNMGEDYVDNRNRDLESSDCPIYMINAVTPEFMGELYGNISNPLLYLGYVIHSAITNTFFNDVDETDLDMISDIALHSMRIGDRVIESVPSDVNIADDIQAELSEEYRNRFEMPEGTLLN